MTKAIISLLTLVLFFASCKKEDNISPVINSINIASNDTLRNTFTLKVEASDNKIIDRVEYYVNDSLITKIIAAPYDYQLNTLKLKEGPGTLKGVVYDAEGNKIESTRNFIVNNLLISLKIGSLLSVPFHMVVSDEKGNILNTATFKADDRKNIIPLTTCDVKAVNIVWYFTYNQNTTMAAYIHVKRGSEFKLGLIPENTPIKQFKLHLKNDLTNFIHLDIVTDMSRYFLNSIADTVILPESYSYTTDHKLLLQLQTSTGRYYKLLPINGAENLTVNLSSVNTPETMKSQIFPLTGSVFYIITAKAAAVDALNEYYISSATREYNSNHIDLFYPAEYFTKYKTLIAYSLLNGSTKSYTNVWLGAVPETFSYLDADAQITSQNLGGFKTVFSGTFDHYCAIYRILSPNVVLNVYAPANQNEWILPDLSTAFGNNAFSQNNFLLYQLLLTDYASLNLANKYYDLDIESIIATESYTQNMTLQVRTK